MDLSRYSCEQLLDDIRLTLNSLGYQQVPALSARGQLRRDGPLAPEPGWIGGWPGAVRAPGT